METILIYAIALGTLFGFVLNRIGATDPTRIINMVRLTDTRLLKTLIFAIGLASTLLFIGLALGIVHAEHLSIKGAHWGVVLGGAILGVGFVIAGLCPGTGLAAMATGRKDAAFFVVGGLLGALVYALIYGSIQDSSLFDAVAGGKASLAETGNVTLVTGISPWLVAAIPGAVMMVVAALLPIHWRK